MQLPAGVTNSNLEANRSRDDDKDYDEIKAQLDSVDPLC